MGISQATSAVLVFLTGLLPASCHKTADTANRKQPPPAAVASSTQPSGAPQAASAKTIQRDLGEIALTNKTDLCIQFDNGEFCTFTPRMLDQYNVRITLAVESRNGAGETGNFTVKQYTAKPGKPLEVAVGDLNFSFTPKIIDAE